MSFCPDCSVVSVRVKDTDMYVSVWVKDTDM